jgi:hypothetical protein
VPRPGAARKARTPPSSRPGRRAFKFSTVVCLNTLGFQILESRVFENGIFSIRDKRVYGNPIFQIIYIRAFANPLLSNCYTVVFVPSLQVFKCSTVVCLKNLQVLKLSTVVCLKPCNFQILDGRVFENPTFSNSRQLCI